LNAATALARLRALGRPVVTTDDAALALGLGRSATSHTLARLAAASLLVRVRHGLWTLEPGLDPLTLAEHLAAPLPAYVSFQSALFLHGMVSQIPQVIYVASLGRTRRVRTSFGTFSIHRLSPGFFGGFDTLPGTEVHLASPEKALLDVLYLAPARSRLFAHLPEVDIRPGFDRRRAREWIARIPAGPRRLAVEQRLAHLLAGRRTRGGSRRR
jgi:predicted transcriptional regulator of viral defense system